MIAWPDGVERGPDNSVYRQLPESSVWSSAVWISNGGVARRRYYNPMTSKWTWEDPLPLTLSEDGRVGLLVHHWMSLERAVAMAWRCRAPDSKPGVHVLPDKPCRARFVRWDEEEESEDPGSIPGEKWKPLEWFCGIVRCNKRYQISNFGRLKSPLTGFVTRGHFYDGQRWAACKDAGLVQLDTAAKLLENVIYLPPYLAQARQALITGHTPAELAALGVEDSTAWNYFCRAAETVSTSELLRLVPKLVPGDLWKALQQIKDERLGGPLKELFRALQTKIPHLDEASMSQLRLARLALVSRKVRPP